MHTAYYGLKNNCECINIITFFPFFSFEHRSIYNLRFTATIKIYHVLAYIILKICYCVTLSLLLTFPFVRAREICNIENSKFLTKTFDDLRPIINKRKDYWEIFVLFSEFFSRLDRSLFSVFLLNDYWSLK